MDDKQFAKLARSIKLPAAGTRRGDKWFWEKRGGHAGANTIARVKTAASTAGWRKMHGSADGNPDGSVVTRLDGYQHDDGHMLVFEASYGVTAAYNRFCIALKLAQ